MTNKQPPAPAEVLFAFVGFYDGSEGDETRGAAMVTNLRGYPLEFRVCMSVRPSAVQKALYGKSLGSYMITELVGKRLIAELRHRPNLVVVNRSGALHTDSPHPLLFVTGADTYVRKDGDPYLYRRLDPVTGEGKALAVLSATASKAVFDTGIEQLSQAYRYFDPIETFGRMKTALEVLAKSDERYR